MLFHDLLRYHGFQLRFLEGARMKPSCAEVSPLHQQEEDRNEVSVPSSPLDVAEE